MATFDGPNLIVTLDPGVVEIDIQEDLYEPWKEWVKAGNSKYVAAFRADGGAPVTEVAVQARYFFFNNVDGWRIRPPEEDSSITFTGNLVGLDSTLPLVIPTIGAFTSLMLGLQPIAQEVEPENLAKAVWDRPVEGVVSGTYGEAARQVGFHNHVYVDQNNGAVGTVYPLGTLNHPVTTIADAVIIANANGVGAIQIAEDITILSTDNIDGFHIKGAHATKSQITVQAGASTNFCQFTECYLVGALDGWIVVRDSLIEDITGVQGIFHNTMINPGSIVLAGTRVSHFLSCYSGIPGLSTPEIDFGGSGRTCAFRDYSGGIKLVNKTGPEPVSMDINSGQVIVDDTVTAGTIVLRGTAVWTNGHSYTGGANVVDQFVEGTMLTDLHAANFHRRVWDKNGNTITIYDDDGVTPRHVFDVNSDLSDINPQ